jgi:hypothetical protein
MRLGQDEVVDPEVVTEVDFRDELLKALRSLKMTPAAAESTVSNLEAVVSKAASDAATSVVRPVLIGAAVGSVVTWIGVWLLTREVKQAL